VSVFPQLFLALMRGDLSEFAFSSAGHFSFSLLDRKTKGFPGIGIMRGYSPQN